MAEKLELIIQVIDNATKEIQGVKDQLNGITDNTRKASEATKNSTKEMNKNWTSLTITMMGLIKAGRLLNQQIVDLVKIGKQIDPEFRAAMNNFDQSVIKVKESIARQLIPYLQTAAEWWTIILNKIPAGMNNDLSRANDVLIRQIEAIDRRLEGINLRREQLKPNASGSDEYLRLNVESAGLEQQRAVLVGATQSIELDLINVKTEMETQYLEDSMFKYITNEQEKINQSRMLYAMWNNEKTETVMANQQRETEFYTFALETQKQAHMSMWAVAGKARDTFASGTTKALMDITKGTFDARDAAEALGLQLLEVLIEFMVQKTVSFALSKTLLAGEVAAANVSGSLVAQAWASAAAMVSLATLGTNSIPASAGITETVILAYALAAPKGFAAGGPVGLEGPELIMVGERGPEYVTPNHELGGDRQVSIHIEINNPQVREYSDIDSLTEAISQRISHEIERVG